MPDGYQGTHLPKSAWTLLPPAPGACQVCAADHAPEQPHNPDSLYWATAREIAGEGPPTWELGMAHCSADMREWWIGKLEERGVKIDRDLLAKLVKEANDA